ncbi:hypothetical protein GS397_27535 (plasmid) [Sphingobium yanoikuyae]|uniref:Uncharacterized protein n=1 Tax=Sphingobium yanoikuyae TaxID=13690 RepID=A0A6P1GQD7_SPHYA|nr:hypothetical protein [Sphingobium yanoikuyae]QHD70856.1 hypothetical protein GS397_27535 [Sphingobium yanoikuyae]
MSYIEGGLMPIIALIFAGVVAYCAWVIRRDDTVLRGLFDRSAKARLSNIILWHKRAAIMSAVGFLVAVVAMIRR